MERDRKLTELLGDLAVEMQAQADATATLQIIVGAAVDLVPAASWAGVSVVAGREVTPAVTDAVAEELDNL